MSDQDRLTAGRAVYARNFGVDDATAQRLMESRAGSAFVAESYVAAGGPGWSGVHLTDRDRSVATIAALVAQGVTDDRLAVYLRVARREGLDDDGLTELMILLTAYVGQPSTSLAMRAVLGSGSQEGPRGSDIRHLT
ncbi:carboxymuconolactone decarboxylase family protein [Salinibacterium soli]|uniref:Carboxymuconolactone decarboxylase family protein n=1 Tax=Antiquaquibacter soli TaxID=3064523 RepID=A0ABT9BLG3_9MICO|nr:carboxymuconolactone decarboxylase family protein [Protaetiibacter sp. WY-16]MDO7881863.1 carboxymuconolactone decarboxylase family protein [Protaetiibacter sp. WY-16]